MVDIYLTALSNVDLGLGFVSFKSLNILSKHFLTNLDFEVPLSLSRCTYQGGIEDIKNHLIDRVRDLKHHTSSDGTP